MGDIGTINIPHWLNRALAVRGLGPGTTLDYPKLQEVFSFEQRVELLMAQSLSFLVFKSDEVGASPHLLVNHWGTSASTELMDDIRSVQREAEKRISQGQSLRGAFENEAETVGSGDSVTFHMQTSTSGHVEVVFLIVTDDFKRLTLQDYFDLTKQLIGQYYKFGRSHRIHRTQVFRNYLNLMYKLGK